MSHLIIIVGLTTKRCLRLIPNWSALLCHQPALRVKILTNVNNKDGTPIIFSTNIFETEKTPRSFVAECRNKVEARQVISLMSEQLGEPMVVINPYHFTNGAT